MQIKEVKMVNDQVEIKKLAPSKDQGLSFDQLLKNFSGPPLADNKILKEDCSDKEILPDLEEVMTAENLEVLVTMLGQNRASYQISQEQPPGEKEAKMISTMISTEISGQKITTGPAPAEVIPGPKDPGGLPLNDLPGGKEILSGQVTEAVLAAMPQEVRPDKEPGLKVKQEAPLELDQEPGLQADKGLEGKLRPEGELRSPPELPDFPKRMTQGPTKAGPEPEMPTSCGPVGLAARADQEIGRQSQLSEEKFKLASEPAIKEEKSSDRSQWDVSVLGPARNNSLTSSGRINDQISPVRQVEAKIIEQFDGKTAKVFKMTLNPENLGEIEVELKVDQGKLLIGILSATQETHELLTRQLDQLIRALALQRIQVENIQTHRFVKEAENLPGQANFSNDNPSQNFSGHQRGAQRGMQSDFANRQNDPGIGESLSQLTPGRQFSRLDYRI